MEYRYTEAEYQIILKRHIIKITILKIHETAVNNLVSEALFKT